MNPGGGAGAPGSPPGNGQPARELLEQERETSPDFVAKVRRRIHRRLTAAELAAFSWQLPKAVFLEMADMLRHLFVSAGGDKGGRR